MAETKNNSTFDDLQVGDHVTHPKFGEGQIMQRTGAGEDTKLVITFAEEGEKKLMAKYAKLKKINAIGSEEKTEEE
ncbi:MAG: hypothetical protein ACLFUS_11240 [Candidatus Sumerlaeia bacterium]